MEIVVNGVLRTLWVGSWVRWLAWGFASCLGVCVLILARVFALGFLRGYLRFARGFNVNGRQWPLMVVNDFWLALLAMVVNGFWVGYGANAR